MTRTKGGADSADWRKLARMRLPSRVMARSSPVGSVRFNPYIPFPLSVVSHEIQVQ